MELLEQYSNKPAHLVDLRMTLRVLADDNPADDPPPLDMARRRSRRGWSLADRLSVDGIAEVIELYRDGTTAADLATRYSTSLSTIKRLLRANGARRRPKRPG